MFVLPLSITQVKLHTSEPEVYISLAALHSPLSIYSVNNPGTVGLSARSASITTNKLYLSSYHQLGRDFSLADSHSISWENFKYKI